MINVSMTFFNPKGESYTLTYDQVMERMYLCDSGSSTVIVSNEEMFLAMESLFNLRGNHEFTKQLCSESRC